jgi:hypothetical protein
VSLGASCRDRSRSRSASSKRPRST